MRVDLTCRNAWFPLYNQSREGGGGNRAATLRAKILKPSPPQVPAPMHNRLVLSPLSSLPIPLLVLLLLLLLPPFLPSPLLLLFQPPRRLLRHNAPYQRVAAVECPQVLSSRPAHALHNLPAAVLHPVVPVEMLAHQDGEPAEQGTAQSQHSTAVGEPRCQCISRPCLRTQ